MIICFVTIGMYENCCIYLYIIKLEYIEYGLGNSGIQMHLPESETRTVHRIFPPTYTVEYVFNYWICLRGKWNDNEENEKEMNAKWKEMKKKWMLNERRWKEMKRMDINQKSKENERKMKGNEKKNTPKWCPRHSKWIILCSQGIRRGDSSYSMYSSLILNIYIHKFDQFCSLVVCLYLCTIVKGYRWWLSWENQVINPSSSFPLPEGLCVQRGSVLVAHEADKVVSPLPIKLGTRFSARKIWKRWYGDIQHIQL